MEAESGASELYFAGDVTNTKTIEALISGTVAFVGAAVNNSGGTILASAAGARVVMNGATISGGTLQTSAGAEFEVLTGDGVLSAVTIETGSLAVADGGALTISGGSIGAGAIVEAIMGGGVNVLGTVANSGTLEAGSGGGVIGTVDISGTVADTAAGVILASKGDVNVVDATISGGTLPGPRRAASSRSAAPAV